MNNETVTPTKFRREKFMEKKVREDIFTSLVFAFLAILQVYILLRSDINIISDLRTRNGFISPYWHLFKIAQSAYRKDEEGWDVKAWRK